MRFMHAKSVFALFNRPANKTSDIDSKAHEETRRSKTGKGEARL
jgi:hypothetical protein